MVCHYPCERRRKEEEEEEEISTCVLSVSSPLLFPPFPSVCVGRVLCVLSLLSVFLLVYLFPVSLPLLHIIKWTISEKEEEEEEEGV